MKYKFKKNEIDMDATNEVFRRIDALEKRVADLTKEVKALKEKEAKSPSPTKAKTTTSKTTKKD